MKGIYKSIDMLKKYLCEKVFTNIDSFISDFVTQSNEKILFVIGNGFDLSHDAKTSFSYYRKYIKTYYNSLYNILNTRIGVDEVSLWSDFENQLVFLKDTYKNYNINSKQSLERFNKDLVLITSLLKDSFKDWMNCKDDNFRIFVTSENLKFKKLIDKNSFYLTFNYTEFLEDTSLYGVPSENVIHIHGSRVKISDKLMTGFNIPIEYAVRFNTKPDLLHGGVNIGGYSASGVETSPIVNYLHDFSKDAYLWEHEDEFNNFLGKIKNCNRVVIIGHSLGFPDRQYFKAIQRTISSDSKWYIGFYSLEAPIYDKDYKENGYEKIQADLISEFIYDLNLKKDNVSLFKY